MIKAIYPSIFRNLFGPWITVTLGFIILHTHPIQLSQQILLKYPPGSPHGRTPRWGYDHEEYSSGKHSGQTDSLWLNVLQGFYLKLPLGVWAFHPVPVGEPKHPRRRSILLPQYPTSVCRSLTQVSGRQFIRWAEEMRSATDILNSVKHPPSQRKTNCSKHQDVIIVLQSTQNK